MFLGPGSIWVCFAVLLSLCLAFNTLFKKLTNGMCFQSSVHLGLSWGSIVFASDLQNSILKLEYFWVQGPFGFASRFHCLCV